MPCTRRVLLQCASALPLAGLAACGGVLTEATPEPAAPPAPGPAAESAPAAGGLPVALNAYSFNRLLNDRLRGRGPGVTLLAVLEFAETCGFDGFDATGYYFPGYPQRPADAYVDAFRRRAAELGLGISGTGVRNNFTTADQAIRAAGVAHIKEWVEVAARLGAPVVRVFADTQLRAQTWETVAPSCTREQVQDWIRDALRECAEHGQRHGVRIGVQNHGDFLRTGRQLLDLVAAVGSPWCGMIVDTGYFRSADPYADMALVAPQALNWQVKQSPFGADSPIATDLDRLLRLIRASGYRGYLPLEVLAPKGSATDPYQVVPDFLAQLRGAIARTA
jgi:sugar phosphate isomerase/epimerase